MAKVVNTNDRVKKIIKSQMKKIMPPVRSLELKEKHSAIFLVPRSSESVILKYDLKGHFRVSAITGEEKIKASFMAYLSGSAIDFDDDVFYANVETPKLIWSINYRMSDEDFNNKKSILKAGFKDVFPFGLRIEAFNPRMKSGIYTRIIETYNLESSSPCLFAGEGHIRSLREGYFAFWNNTFNDDLVYFYGPCSERHKKRKDFDDCKTCKFFRDNIGTKMRGDLMGMYSWQDSTSHHCGGSFLASSISCDGIFVSMNPKLVDKYKDNVRFTWGEVPFIAGLAKLINGGAKIALSKNVGFELPQSKFIFS